MKDGVDGEAVVQAHKLFSPSGRTLLSKQAKAGLAAAVAVVVGAMSAPAVAADPGLYVGLTGGQAMYDIDKGELDETILFVFDAVGAPVLAGDSSLDDEDTAFSFLIGYRFSPYLAIEAAYLDLGEANYAASGLVDDGFGGAVPVDLSLSADASGPALSVLGILPVADAWELFARAGILFADTEARVRASALGDSASESVSESSEEFLVGLGVAYNFMNRWAARLEFQRAMDVGNGDIGEADVDVVSLGVTVAF